MESAARFMYLNRHGFNGLCRYNRRGQFNVPFGKYKKPYFPLDEIHAFKEKAKRATFITAHYSETLELVRDGYDVIYCDPPYLTESDNFTAYHGSGFTHMDQGGWRGSCAGWHVKGLVLLPQTVIWRWCITCMPVLRRCR